MKALPQELIYEIVDHLYRVIVATEERDPGCLAKYAPVSRGFQDAIERHTFKSIELKSDELDIFRQYFSNSRRQALLNSINYMVRLPGYEDSRRLCYENHMDRQNNDQAATGAMDSLLMLLSQ
ncbi:hypothetical protein CORC01_00856 [Colletotrichum orchidophilum]|uniref:F-box domain-containing protein n=1 Tax=Colletotrichum orchidophilum TaxID=1209926 RepID=A0A1G4BRB1_9PEZI|nr:uncharacterized protein CORC01_00856 [Colletotrichum orchidophilum]OHF03994.1 hypothetical protein CORC01_00856 [Colletotrichum orchidophilum]